MAEATKAEQFTKAARTIKEVGPNELTRAAAVARTNKKSGTT